MDRSEVESLMKRGKAVAVGKEVFYEARNIIIECHEMLGKLSSERDKYKSLMIDMGKMYFHLDNARCINAPEEDDHGLLNKYKEYADQVAEEIREIVIMEADNGSS